MADDECQHGEMRVEVLDGPWPVVSHRCVACGVVVSELCSVDRAVRDRLLIVPEVDGGDDAA